jgi:hypothetical protein
MTQNLNFSPNPDAEISMPVDAKLFLLALRSYPEQFRRQPSVSFEQHFWSLLTATQPALRRGHAAGR